MKKIILSLICCLAYLFVYSQQFISIYDESGIKNYFIENETVKYVLFLDSLCVEDVKEFSSFSEHTDTMSHNMFRFTIHQNKNELFVKKLKNHANLLYSNELIYIKDSAIQWCFNEILLQTKQSHALKDVLDHCKIQYKSYKQFGFFENEYLVTLEFCEALKYANILYESGLVYYSVPSFYRFNSLQNTHYSSQWGLKNTGQNGGIPGIDINVEQAWELSTGEGIKIAVLDNGVQMNHPDLQDNILQGFDATGNGSNGNFTGSDSHGTCCSGIISAVDNNIGIKGIAYNAQLIPIRIFINKIFKDEDIIRGFQLAFDANVDVISCSWRYEGSAAPTLNKIINAIVTYGRNGLGCPILFASGNYDESFVRYPAALPSTIAVGAISPCGERKNGVSCDGEDWGSNYGRALDVVAPGVLIPTTTIGSEYTLYFNGTSSACPHAAGVMALILSANPCLTQLEARALLCNSCDTIGNYNYSIEAGKYFGLWNDQMGYGLINAYKAVSSALTIQSHPHHVSGTVSNITNQYKWILANSTYSGLASGTYFVKRYEITKIITFPYTRNPMISATVNGFSAANPNTGEYYFTSSNITNTSATFKTWVYEVLYNANGQTINRFVPAHPDDIYFDIYIMETPNTNININNEVVQNGIYHLNAFNTIETSNFVVSETASAILHAGSSIVLQNGTIISPQTSGYFRAYVEPFNPCLQKNSSSLHPILSYSNAEKESFCNNNSVDTSVFFSKNLCSIYPNPNNGNFFIELSNPNTEIVRIQIKNCMGKTVFERNGGGEKEISLNAASSGLYFVILTLKNQIITQKIIVK